MYTEHKGKSLSIISTGELEFTSGFWAKRVGLVQKEVIFYQWQALNDEIPGAEPSHAVENFRIAAGRSDEDFQGMVFQDSDLAKWLEAAAFSLNSADNPELEEKIDEVVDLIGEAQQENGYINTYFTVKEPDKKWVNLRDWHELYCAGHLIEAAVAYYRATGKEKFLNIMCDFADLIEEKFGPAEDQIPGYPGHEEIELALVKLFRVTGEKKYLDLSKFFVDRRGQKPNYFRKEAKERGADPDYWDLLGYKYNQAHLPVREQTEAVGHSVRAVYLYSGMADLARETGDEELKEACLELWENTVNRRMYITGGIGSSGYGESFTFDYDLPPDTSYTETCASIGLVFWARRMLELEMKSEYADVMEKALYNGVLSGISLDGEKYFYVNPLEVWPEACRNRRDKGHVKPTRQKWFGCACCPPNIARLLASLGDYAYSQSGDGIYVHLYADSKLEIDHMGTRLQLNQKTDYPWNGKIKIEVNPETRTDFTLALRVPGWAEEVDLQINGEQKAAEEFEESGYLKISRKWTPGDTVELNLPLEIKRKYAHPELREHSGQVALQRGPVIYCLEEVDNGANLSAISLPRNSELIAEYQPDLLEGVTVIRGPARRSKSGPGEQKEELYRDQPPQKEEIVITAVPYYAWDNRQQGEMRVWIDELTFDKKNQQQQNAEVSVLVDNNK